MRSSKPSSSEEGAATAAVSNGVAESNYQAAAPTQREPRLRSIGERVAPLFQQSRARAQQTAMDPNRLLRAQKPPPENLSLVNNTTPVLLPKALHPLSFEGIARRMLQTNVEEKRVKTQPEVMDEKQKIIAPKSLTVELGKHLNKMYAFYVMKQDKWVSLKQLDLTDVARYVNAKGKRAEKNPGRIETGVQSKNGLNGNRPPASSKAAPAADMRNDHTRKRKSTTPKKRISLEDCPRKEAQKAERQASFVIASKRPRESSKCKSDNAKHGELNARKRGFYSHTEKRPRPPNAHGIKQPEPKRDLRGTPKDGKQRDECRANTQPHPKNSTSKPSVRGQIVKAVPKIHPQNQRQDPGQRQKPTPAATAARANDKAACLANMANRQNKQEAHLRQAAVTAVEAGRRFADETIAAICPGVRSLLGYKIPKLKPNNSEEQQSPLVPQNRKMGAKSAESATIPDSSPVAAAKKEATKPAEVRSCSRKTKMSNTSGTRAKASHLKGKQAEEARKSEQEGPAFPMVGTQNIAVEGDQLTVGQEVVIDNTQDLDDGFNLGKGSYKDAFEIGDGKGSQIESFDRLDEFVTEDLEKDDESDNEVVELFKNRGKQQHESGASGTDSDFSWGEAGEIEMIAKWLERPSSAIAIVQEDILLLDETRSSTPEQLYSVSDTFGTFYVSVSVETGQVARIVDEQHLEQINKIKNTRQSVSVEDCETETTGTNATNANSVETSAASETFSPLSPLSEMITSEQGDMGIEVVEGTAQGNEVEEFDFDMDNVSSLMYIDPKPLAALSPRAMYPSTPKHVFGDNEEFEEKIGNEATCSTAAKEFEDAAGANAQDSDSDIELLEVMSDLSDDEIISETEQEDDNDSEDEDEDNENEDGDIGINGDGELEPERPEVPRIVEVIDLTYSDSGSDESEIESDATTGKIPAATPIPASPPTDDGPPELVEEEVQAKEYASTPTAAMPVLKVQVPISKQPQQQQQAEESTFTTSIVSTSTAFGSVPAPTGLPAPVEISLPEEFPGLAEQHQGTSTDRKLKLFLANEKKQPDLPPEKKMQGNAWKPYIDEVDADAPEAIDAELNELNIPFKKRRMVRLASLDSEGTMTDTSTSP